MVARRNPSRRNPLKRKSDATKTSSPTKKARLVLMKELAEIYKNDELNKDNLCYYFNCFYEKKKLIYPWLKKDTLRWHIRAMNKKGNVTKTTTNTTNAYEQDPNCVETITIDQHQVSLTWF